MTQQEILEYNKMCAEILGYKNKGMKNLEMWVSNKTPNGVNTNELQFHLDWNWIMEVVEAIENLKTETSQFEFYFQPKSVIIKEEKNYSFEKGDGGRSSQPLKFNGSVWITGKTKKEAVVQAINQFLIWYNNEH